LFLQPEAIPGEPLFALDDVTSAAPHELTVSREFVGQFGRVDYVPIALYDLRENVGTTSRCAAPSDCVHDLVVFDGTGWVHKLVVADSTADTFVPFDGDGYEPYDFAVGATLRLNTLWMNYQVTRVDEATYDVRRIVETWAHPSNAAGFVPDGMTLVSATSGVTYRLDTDPARPTYLQPVLATGPGAGEAAGWHGPWWIAEDAPALDRKWIWYPEFTTHYLMDGAGYVRFGDPLFFEPVALRTATGEERRYLLQSYGTYAEIPGWNYTLPRLGASGGEMTREIARYVPQVPAGTEVVEYGGARRRFLLKPLEVEQHLLPATAPDLDLAAAEELRTTPLPPLTAPEPRMGPIPDLAAAPLRYVEGRSAAEP
jgi:hypothetical protein